MQIYGKYSSLLIWGWLLFIFGNEKLTGAYRILFMGPFPAPSHWMWLEHFQNDLLGHGHHVTSITNYPAKQKHPNLTEIIINPRYDVPKYCKILSIKP